MRSAALCLYLLNKFFQRWELCEAAFGDRLVDPRQILHDHAASADIGVSDFGIAHLTVGQADIMLAGVKMGVRPARHQLVPYRGLGALDRVVRAAGALPPAIENAQHDRTRP